MSAVKFPYALDFEPKFEFFKVPYRNKGYGTLLMQCIEKEAKANGGTNSYLNTIAFQAPEFYKSLGYQVFAELENFHHQYNKLFFKKKL